MKRILLYFLLLIPFMVRGQMIEVELDTNSILIGEQTKLRVSVLYRNDGSQEVKLSFPKVGDTLVKQIEVLSASKLDTSLIDENDPYAFRQTQVLTITSFEAGNYNIPPFIATFNGFTLSSDVLQIKVHDVVLPENEELAQIKEPLTDPMTVWDWISHHWLFFFLPLIAVLVMVLILFFFLSNRSKKVKAPVIPKEPAHVVALQKLREIASAGLWQEGEFKQYHSELSVVIREYLERRYQIRALEQTSDEIFVALRFKSLSGGSKEKLKQLLVLADLVKFAKEIPIGDENEESMQLATSFVEETKLVKEQENNS